MEQNIVAAQAAETAPETGAEPTKKTFDQDQVNELVGKARAQGRAKADREYAELAQVLRTGTGKADLAEITKDMRTFFEGKGATADAPLSREDVATLADKDAASVIDGGLEDVEEEMERLEKLESRSPRQEATYAKLGEYRQQAQRAQALEEMGVSKAVYESKEFAEFAAQFQSTVPIQTIYRHYEKIHDEKPQTMGSMKSRDSGDRGVKDYYTREEAMRFTRADLEKTPGLMEALERSAAKW